MKYICLGLPNVHVWISKDRKESVYAFTTVEQKEG